MSYAICRVQKIKGASSVHGIQGHQRRERESHTNPDIDYNRKDLNYSFTEETQKSFNALADERIKQGYTGKKAIRKDAVKVVSALFTSDNEFFQDKPLYEQRKFFENCYDWACEKFGKSNIFSAIVHMDEETPHLHIEFVPLTSDGRLSAKAVLGGRVDLQRMQDDFFQKVGKPWGLERGERADLENSDARRPRKHLETSELKQKTASEVKALETERDRLAFEVKKLTSEHSEMHGYLTETRRQHEKALKDSIELRAEIDFYKDLNISVQKADLEEKKIPFSDKTAVKSKELVTIKEQAKSYRVNRKEIKKLRKKAEELADKDLELEKKALELTQKEKEISETEAKTRDKYQLQLNINTAYKEIAEELEQCKNDNAQLRENNGVLRASIEEQGKNHI